MDPTQISSGACFDEWERKKAEQESKTQQNLMMYVMVNPRSDEDTAEERSLKTKCRNICKEFVKYHQHTPVMMDYSQRFINADVMVKTMPLSDFMAHLEATKDKPWAALTDHAFQWAKHRQHELMQNQHSEFIAILEEISGVVDEVKDMARREAIDHAAQAAEERNRALLEQAMKAAEEEQERVRLEEEAKRKKKEEEARKKAEEAEEAARKEAEKAEKAAAEELRKKQMVEAKLREAQRLKERVAAKLRQKEEERKKKEEEKKAKRDAIAIEKEQQEALKKMLAEGKEREVREAREAKERERERQKLAREREKEKHDQELRELEERERELREKGQLDQETAAKLKAERDRIEKEKTSLRQREKEELARQKAEREKEEREEFLARRAEEEARHQDVLKNVQRSKTMAARNGFPGGPPDKFNRANTFVPDPYVEHREKEEKKPWGYGIKKPAAKLVGKEAILAHEFEQREQFEMQQAKDAIGRSKTLNARNSFHSGDAPAWKPSGESAKAYFGVNVYAQAPGETGALYADQGPGKGFSSPRDMPQWRSGGAVERTSITKDLLHDEYQEKKISEVTRGGGGGGGDQWCNNATVTSHAQMSRTYTDAGARYRKSGHKSMRKSGSEGALDEAGDEHSISGGFDPQLHRPEFRVAGAPGAAFSRKFTTDGEEACSYNENGQLMDRQGTFVEGKVVEPWYHSGPNVRYISQDFHYDANGRAIDENGNLIDSSWKYGTKVCYDSYGNPYPVEGTTESDGELAELRVRERRWRSTVPEGKDFDSRASYHEGHYEYQDGKSGLQLREGGVPVSEDNWKGAGHSNGPVWRELPKGLDADDGYNMHMFQKPVRVSTMLVEEPAEKNKRRGSQIGTATAWDRPSPSDNKTHLKPINADGRKARNSAHERTSMHQSDLLSTTSFPKTKNNRMSRVEANINPQSLSLEMSVTPTSTSTSQGPFQGPGSLQAGKRMSRMSEPLLNHSASSSTIEEQGQGFSFPHVGLRVAALIDSLIPNITKRVAMINAQRAPSKKSTTAESALMFEMQQATSRRVIALVHEGLFGDTSDLRKSLQQDGRAENPEQFMAALKEQREKKASMGLEKDTKLSQELFEGDENMLQQVLKCVHGELHRQMPQYIKLVMQHMGSQSGYQAERPPSQPPSSPSYDAFSHDTNASANERNAADLAVVEMAFAHTMTQRLSVARPSYRATKVRAARVSDHGDTRASFEGTIPGWGSRKSHHLAI